MKFLKIIIPTIECYKLFISQSLCQSRCIADYYLTMTNNAGSKDQKKKKKKKGKVRVGDSEDTIVSRKSEFL